MLRSILKQFISKRKFRISLEKGHFRSLEKKGRGLDPQDPPRSCAPVLSRKFWLESMVTKDSRIHTGSGALSRHISTVLFAARSKRSFLVTALLLQYLVTLHCYFALHNLPNSLVYSRPIASTILQGWHSQGCANSIWV